MSSPPVAHPGSSSLREAYLRLARGIRMTFSMPHLTADEIDSFRVAQAEARMPIVVPTVVAGVLLIAGFFGWDLMREGGRVSPALVVRLGGGLALLVLLAGVRLAWRPSYRTQALLFYGAFFSWQTAIGAALGPQSPLQLPGCLLVMFFSVLALPRASDSLINLPLVAVAIAVVVPRHATQADWTYAGAHFATVFALVWAATALIERMSAQSFAYRRRLQHEASIDALTGIPNRREFESAIVREMDRARRLGLPLMLALMDIDHFKQVNDRHGHDGGDALLRGVAQSLAGHIRRSDVLARIGGEEFALILLGTEPEGARVVLARLREGIEALRVRAGGIDIACTISIGVAEATAEDRDWQRLYKRADEALYGAKAGGRNRIVEAESGSA